ncbi:MAG: hypothetical protein E7437_02200 [Ruminococcaceae bacterium]|nr:hypothetical protein [Oscillospiraceae bacterium]
MKRLLPLILAVLMLAACAKETAPEPTATVPTETTEATGTDLPDGVALMTEQPQPGVTGYDLSVWGIGSFGEVYPYKDGVALLEASGVLWLMDPETGLITGSCKDVFSVLTGWEEGFACAQSDTTLLTYTYGIPQGISWKLPGDIQGQPVIDPQGKQIYYCTPGKVFALDMSTGLTRLLREHTYEELHPIQAGGETLLLTAEEDSLVIATDDGRTVYDDQTLRAVAVYGDRILTTGTEDGVKVTLMQKSGQVLWALDCDLSQAIVTPGMEGLLLWKEGSLCHYSLEDGKLTAQATLPVRDPWIAPVEDQVWILADNTLYRWDLTADTELTAKETIQIPYYTDQTPDQEGLEQCKTRARALEEQYGLSVHVYDEICSDGTVAVDREYRVDVINTMLDDLEKVLPLLPEGFISDTVQNGKFCVDLVKNIQDGQTFAQFWHDRDCHVAITLSADMQEAFLTGFGWAVDTHILGNSRDLEYWNDENPNGFSYDYDYAVSAQRDDTYLIGQERYFTDKRAMAFPTEDRARIFYHAMLPDNAELFQSPVLQKKLIMVCEGIREAYGLKKHEQALPWEQYLEEPMI